MQLERSRDQFVKKGLGVVAISYDSRQVLQNFSNRVKIGFPLFSDEGSAVIRAFGILNTTACSRSSSGLVPACGKRTELPVGTPIGITSSTDWIGGHQVGFFGLGGEESKQRKRRNDRGLQFTQGDAHECNVAFIDSNRVDGARACPRLRSGFAMHVALADSR